MSFSAEGITPSGESKYQTAGVSERVKITEIVVIDGPVSQSLQFKTENEHGKYGLSKRLSLNTVVSPGKSVSAWKVSAKYIQNVILSATGCSVEDSQKVLSASSVDELKKNLESALIGKEFRGLFSSREYQQGKFAIELYTTEPVGGKKLVYDPTNKTHNQTLEPVVEQSGTSGLPF